ncbi:MAG: nucleoside hydrolase, partial [Chloroflexi bacterium]|nr:nucleoside hydrolase [Chloroflexota bacterium]
DMPHRTDWPQHTAVDFLRRTIRSRPGEIVLLTIGPFANAALLFALDPEIPSLLKGMVSMAGDFFSTPLQSEWNCKVDPVSTAMVYAAAPQGALSIGLDVTTRCQLSTETVRQRFQAAPLNVVLSMAEVWFKHSSQITFHDPLAAAVVFHPGICSYESGAVEAVALEDQGRAGTTHFTPHPDGRLRVARLVDTDAFFTEYFSVFDA